MTYPGYSPTEPGTPWMPEPVRTILPTVVVQNLRVINEPLGLRFPSFTGSANKMVGVPFCPDLLRYEDIGEADDLRGRMVRAFFWLLAKIDWLFGGRA